MDDELTLYLSQRAELLASDGASLDQLKAHDRQLLGLIQTAPESPSPLAAGTDPSELADQLAVEPERLLCVMEARDRMWPGELSRIQARLINEHESQATAWWLAAHYRTLPCPPEFPQAFIAQVWAARALERRGYPPPAPWAGWYAGIHGQGESFATAVELWQAGNGALWQQWLPPLLAAADDTDVTALYSRCTGRKPFTPKCRRGRPR